MEERSSPLIPQIALWIVFAILAAVSVFTVLVPELASTDENEEEAAPAPPRAP